MWSWNRVGGLVRVLPTPSGSYLCSEQLLTGTSVALGWRPFFSGYEVLLGSVSKLEVLGVNSSKAALTYEV